MALSSTRLSPGKRSPRLSLASLLFGLTSFSSFISAVAAQSDGNSSEPLNIYRDSDQYAYQGCFNETLEVSSSSSRALSGGSFNDSDAMTVSTCLDFCAEGGNGDDSEGSDGDTQAYQFAGLQFARECWCAHRISGLSEQLDDADCDMPCDGDNSTACGGHLRLSVYQMESSAAADAARLISNRGLGGVASVAVAAAYWLSLA